MQNKINLLRLWVKMGPRALAGPEGGFRKALLPDGGIPPGQQFTDLRTVFSLERAALIPGNDFHADFFANYRRTASVPR
jgi:hypothetical protein